MVVKYQSKVKDAINFRGFVSQSRLGSKLQEVQKIRDLRANFEKMNPKHMSLEKKKAFGKKPTLSPISGSFKNQFEIEDFSFNLIETPILNKFTSL